MQFIKKIINKENEINKPSKILFFSFIGLIISGLTGGHNTDSPSKEIAVFYDLELLYNFKRLRAPGNRTPPKKYICLSCKLPYLQQFLKASNDNFFSLCYKLIKIRFKIIRSFHYLAFFIVNRFSINI